jgi:putative flippase GtrA
VTSFTRNALTSCVTTALDFAVLTGLVELAQVNYVIAVFCGSATGAITNFFVNRHWSFRAANARAEQQLIRFLPVQIASVGLQTAGVWLLTSQAGVRYLWSKAIVAISVYLVWNYPLNRYFVFRKAVR